MLIELVSDRSPCFSPLELRGGGGYVLFCELATIVGLVVWGGGGGGGG